MPTERWSDARLQDRFSDLERRLAVTERGLALLQDMGVRLIKVEGRMVTIAEDAAECREGVARVNAALDRTANVLQEDRLSQAKAKLDERQQLAVERKSDRRWLVGTMLTSGALVVATFAALSGYIG